MMLLNVGSWLFNCTFECRQLTLVLEFFRLRNVDASLEFTKNKDTNVSTFPFLRKRGTLPTFRWWRRKKELFNFSLFEASQFVATALISIWVCVCVCLMKKEIRKVFPALFRQSVFVKGNRRIWMTQISRSFYYSRFIAPHQSILFNAILNLLSTISFSKLTRPIAMTERAVFKKLGQCHCFDFCWNFNVVDINFSILS